MKYAVISDIHGNFDALNAVLLDAKVARVDHFLFLGDFIGDYHQPNEVIDTIRNLKNSLSVRGNKEDYLKNLIEENVNIFSHEQFFPIKWNINELSSVNSSFLDALPEMITFSATDTQSITLAHAPKSFFGLTSVDQLDGAEYTKKFKNNPISHPDYLKYAHELLAEDNAFLEKLEEFSNGIILFGHRHTQWHVQFGEKILVNPGSCGMPNNFDTRASYTIIEYVNHSWKIDERRVAYDIEKMIYHFQHSKMFSVSEIWGKLNSLCLQTAENQTMQFLEFANKLAIELGESSWPFSNSVWTEARKRWFKKNGS